MQIPTITLTTDLGLKDFYLPSVKGYIMANLPAANIIDITHQVEPFNIGEAAFILKNAYKHFPKGSLHIVDVDSDYEQDTGFILIRTDDHMFLAHDNGILSLVLPLEEIRDVYRIPHEREQLNFSLLEVMAPAACLACSHISLEEKYYKETSFRIKANLQPVLEENIIRCTVIYIDRTGNIITNVARQDIERYGPGRKFRINITRKEYFDRIYTTYTDVEEGEKVCFFGSAGLLEIAINKGSASGLLGIQKGHLVMIEFL